ncbi:MAG: hypothetical protein JWQ99_3346 [Blastococcus sp.]|nr:hypothetical protein [Blastococcus sp.]
MNLATSLGAAHQTDFDMACADLARAKRAMRAKDTPTARERVGRCAARVDAILDLSNEVAASP